MVRLSSITRRERSHQLPQDLLPLPQVKREEKKRETGVVEGGGNGHSADGRRLDIFTQARSSGVPDDGILPQFCRRSTAPCIKP